MKWMLNMSLALFITSILVSISFPVFAAGSATLSLSSNEIVFKAGDTFTIDIEAQANNEALDTVRAYVSFPADLLQATDASLGNLFPRTSPGSSIDNEAGEISIGGFTLDEPVNISGTFATLTFIVIKEGTAQITLLPTSRMISNGEEKINASLLGSTMITIESVEEEIPEGAGALTILCESHPDINFWYKETNVNCTWGVEGGATEITKYYVAFDQDPLSELAEETQEKSFTRSDVTDGVWYFHVMGVHEGGVTTLIEHYPIRIDAVSPNPILPTVSLEQALVGEPVELLFGTTDDGSGIAYYEVAINGGIYIPQTSPFVLTNLEEGTYLFQVGAVDYAGNSTYGSVSTRVYPEGTELDRPVGADKAVSIWKSNQWIFVGAGVIVLLLIGGGIFIATRRRKNISQF